MRDIKNTFQVLHVLDLQCCWPCPSDGVPRFQSVQQTGFAPFAALRAG